MSVPHAIRQMFFKQRYMTERLSALTVAVLRCSSLVSSTNTSKVGSSLTQERRKNRELKFLLVFIIRSRLEDRLNWLRDSVNTTETGKKPGKRT